MRFDHLVITRLGYRPKPGNPDARFINRPAAKGSSFDPLEPHRLELRQRLFEIACLPSVLGQTEQAFAWVLVVDPELPRPYRDRLAELTAGRPRTFIHDYDPEEPISRTGWLQRYLESPPLDYLLTTNLDSDDALPVRFAQELQALVRGRGDRAAAVELFGARDTLEWDLAVSGAAPRGYRAAWHRDDVRVSSCGFSLLARYPDFDRTVQGLKHSHADDLLAWDRPARNREIEYYRSELERDAERAGLSLRDHPPSETFHDFSPLTGPPLMTNHEDNVAYGRLYERKSRERVTGPESFPDVRVDWDAFDRWRSDFRVSRGARLRYVYRQAQWRFRRATRRIRRTLRSRGRGARP